MSELSVHDNLLTGYDVDCERRRVVLHTRFQSSEQAELTDVVFDDVFAYRFENDVFGTILFDVAECDVAHLLRSESANSGRR